MCSRERLACVTEMIWCTCSPWTPPASPAQWWPGTRWRCRPSCWTSSPASPALEHPGYRRIRSSQRSGLLCSEMLQNSRWKLFIQAAEAFITIYIHHCKHPLALPENFKIFLFQYLDLDVETKMVNDNEELRKELKFWRKIRSKVGLDNWTFVEKKFSTFHDKIAVNRL